MKCSVQKIALVISCLTCAFVDARPLAAEVTVQTSSGSVLTGEIDEQTDGQLLWIRQQTEQIMLTTSVPWSSIVSASRDGEVLPLENLPELLGQQVSREPVGFLVQQVVYHSPMVQQPLHHKKSSVRSLSVEAFLVNLDRDVEPDGLEIVVAPLDEFGVAVPVKGNLSVRLLGERLRPQGGAVDYEEIQRWTHPVVEHDFVDGIARYAFHFRTVDPAFDLSLGPEALANVRLGVFGQGNYEASVPVLIREFIPFRNRLLLNRGDRFLPGELTGGVRRRPSLRVPYRRSFFSH